MHCYYAMNGLSINNFGRVRPCCVAKTFKSISGAPGVIDSKDMDWINTWPIVQKDTGEFGFQPSVQAARNVQDLLNDPVLCNLRKQLKKNLLHAKDVFMLKNKVVSRTEWMQMKHIKIRSTKNQ